MGEYIVNIFACFTVTSKFEQVDIKISHDDPILFSLLIVSKSSYKVTVNISISAFGGVFGLYTIPTILCFSELEPVSINIDSNICGIKTLRSSRILKCISSLIKSPTTPLLPSSRQRVHGNQVKTGISGH